MPFVASGFDEWRFGYSLNPPKPDMYPHQYSQVFVTAQLDRGQPQRSRGPGSAFPTSIIGQRSWKWPGSLHLQQASPGLTAAPAAEVWPRDWWREHKGGDGRWYLQRSPFCPSPWVPVPLDATTPLWGSRGPLNTQPGTGIGRERAGREGEGRERERERLVRGSPTPWARH